MTDTSTYTPPKVWKWEKENMQDMHTCDIDSL